MRKILLSLLFLTVITACELPDVKGLNETPKTTKQMGENLDEVKRLTLVKAGKEDLENPDHWDHISPIPDKIWAGGKLFGENGTNEEILDYVYLKLNALREVVPTYGLDENMEPIPVPSQELAKIRVQKLAVLYGLMAVSSYMQDAKISEMVTNYINANHNRQSTALAVLAMRAFFIRELLLKESFKIDSSKPETLYNSGAMRDAYTWLIRLDAVSRLQLRNKSLEIKVSVVDKTGNNLINFEEVHNLSSRQETAKMWQLALEKAQAGQKDFTANNSESNEDPGELEAQKSYIQRFQQKVQDWAEYLQ
jgi:hypothetical protein